MIEDDAANDKNATEEGFVLDCMRVATQQRRERPAPRLFHVNKNEQDRPIL
jgi:hypothetical protein